jgi:hypothetical protein
MRVLLFNVGAEKHPKRRRRLFLARLGEPPFSSSFSHFSPGGTFCMQKLTKTKKDRAAFGALVARSLRCVSSV